MKSDGIPDLGPMRVITLDDVAWSPYVDPTGWMPPGAYFRKLSSGEHAIPFSSFKLPPFHVAPSHWHPYATVYIVQRGTFIVEGEGTYRPGDVRWVVGGTAYGQESTNEEGCEVLLISLGPIANKNPALEPPPNGHWHEHLKPSTSHERTPV